MKIAVVSSQRPSGKTALSLMLCNIFPLAVGKESAYLTNKSLTEVLKYTNCSETEPSVEKGISVFSALSRTDTIRDGEVFDYAYKPQGTKTMLFDAYNSTVKDETALQDFFNVMKLLGNTFTVVDVSGDITDPVVSQILDACDAVIYTFGTNLKDLEDFLTYYQSLDENQKLRILPVCTMWDNRGVKKKTVQDKIKIKTNKIMWMPYNQNIPRLMLEGKLESSTKLMKEGKLSMLPVRDPLTQLLSKLLDTKQGKVVKEYSKWGV